MLVLKQNAFFWRKRTANFNLNRSNSCYRTKLLHLAFVTVCVSHFVGIFDEILEIFFTSRNLQ